MSSARLWRAAVIVALMAPALLYAAGARSDALRILAQMGLLSMGVLAAVMRLVRIERSRERERAIGRLERELKERREAAATRSTPAPAYASSALLGARRRPSLGLSVAQASHELRGPLTVVRSFAWALRRGEHDPERLAALANIEHEVERAGALVDDLLALARLRDAGLAVRPSRQDVAGLVAGLIGRFGPVAEQRGVTLAARGVEWPVQADVDHGRFEQIVANLVTNALDHAPSGGRVTVALRREDDRLQLEVVDDGAGIAPGDLPLVFEPYFQGVDRRRGAGLGLSVVRELVEAHGGSVVATTVPAGGACFRVTLPVAALTTRRAGADGREVAS